MIPTSLEGLLEAIERLEAANHTVRESMEAQYQLVHKILADYEALQVKYKALEQDRDEWRQAAEDGLVAIRRLEAVPTPAR